MAYSSKYPTKQKQLFVETGVYLSKETENGPNMTRNYTFGNNLNQNALF